ncbi:MAG: thioredoxin domain-containing protein [Patescibacteria group bacterium]
MDLSRKEQKEIMRQEKEAAQERERKKRLREYVAFGIIIAVIIAGFVFLGVKFGGNSGSEVPALPVGAISDSDWVKGNKGANLTLIEYSDFQCPACASYYPIVKQVMDNFSDKVAFAYRHFPLSQHKNAELAAITVEAAGRQGKFWEMHDAIFNNQKEWSENSNVKELFIKYAGEIGLNVEQFKPDIESGELKDKVKRDLNSGISAGVNSTPTFFLNAKKISPTSYEDFKNIIEQSINNNL